MSLQPFVLDNQESKTQRKRIKWPERLEMIKQHFPDSADINWSEALNDNEVFARVIRDVLKAQQHLNRSDDERSVAGRRPNIDIDDGMAAWRELMGRAYSELGFQDSMRLLAADRTTGKQHSLSHIASKTGISRSRVHRLISGEENPDIADMEMIAKAYNRKPSFFTEYRIYAITAFMMKSLEVDPGISISLYEEITK